MLLQENFGQANWRELEVRTCSNKKVAADTVGLIN